MNYHANSLPIRKAEWDDNGVSSLVQCRIGEASLPVVLCAPHGGNEVDGAQAERWQQRPEHLPGVRTLSDVGTLQLCEEVDRRLTQMTGHAAYVVMARFHRQFIDANRDALDDNAVAVCPGCESARETHDLYHYRIDAAVRKHNACHREGRLLLLDIHGQAKHSEAVLLGTQGGDTADIEALERPGEGFLWHLRRELGGALQQGGVAVDGCVSSTVLPERGGVELSGYRGGYTVQRHSGLGVNAIQLEFGDKWRRAAGKRGEAAQALATALFYHLQPLVPFVADAAQRLREPWGRERQLRVVGALQKLGLATPARLMALLESGSSSSSSSEDGSGRDSSEDVSGRGSHSCLGDEDGSGRGSPPIGFRGGAINSKKDKDQAAAALAEGEDSSNHSSSIAYVKGNSSIAWVKGSRSSQGLALLNAKLRRAREQELNEGEAAALRESFRMLL